MLAGLLNIPKTPEEKSIWSFLHQDQHTKIIASLYSSSGNLLPTFAFDPMPETNQTDGNFITWLQNHQAAHTAFTSALGIDGNDLSDVDFSKEDQLASFIRLHWEEHYQAQQQLGFSD